jgi:hypothetical protein
MPLESSGPKATADLMVPWKAGPAFSDTEMQWVVARFCQQLVRTHHDDRVVMLDEILKSRKPCSSKRLASHRADSTRASAVGLPYLASSACRETGVNSDSDGTPASEAALAISLT